MRKDSTCSLVTDRMLAFVHLLKNVLQPYLPELFFGHRGALFFEPSKIHSITCSPTFFFWGVGGWVGKSVIAVFIWGCLN